MPDYKSEDGSWGLKLAIVR